MTDASPEDVHRRCSRPLRASTVRGTASQRSCEPWVPEQLGKARRDTDRSGRSSSPADLLAASASVNPWTSWAHDVPSDVAPAAYEVADDDRALDLLTRAAILVSA